MTGHEQQWQGWQHFANVRAGNLDTEVARGQLRNDEVNLYIAPAVVDINLLASVAHDMAKVQDKDNFAYQFHFYNNPDSMILRDLLRQSLESNFSGISSSTVSGLTEEVGSASDFMKILTGFETPFVSLRTINASYFKPGEASVSREWHIDSSKYTLATTFYGRAMEWTPDSNVNRDYFEGDNKIMKLGEAETLAIHDEAQIYDLPEGSIAILKGEIREDEAKSTLSFFDELGLKGVTPFNERGGLVHRGPLLGPGDIRLTLTVSTF